MSKVIGKLASWTCKHVLKNPLYSDSIYGLLAEWGERLIQEDNFTELFKRDNQKKIYITIDDI
ncbi:MAG: hypothetical protein ABFC57_03695 [Veillonellales bacterium]